MNTSVSADIAKEKMYALARPKTQQQEAERPQERESVTSTIFTQTEDDLALLSTAVSVRDVSKPATGSSLRNAARLGLNAAALEQSFKELYKKSKSHNLLMERFMAHVKFSSIQMLCSMLGMSAEEQEAIKSEVRREALEEIDTKLKQDWAYSKALLEIVG